MYEEGKRYEKELIAKHDYAAEGGTTVVFKDGHGYTLHWPTKKYTRAYRWLRRQDIYSFRVKWVMGTTIIIKSVKSKYAERMEKPGSA